MEDNRTFSQEDVNNIVQKRLAEEKAKYEKQLQDMQAEVTRRENRLSAAGKLQAKGLPSELIDLVKLDDEKSMDDSIALLEKTHKQTQSSAVPTRIQGATPASSVGTQSGDRIREAMGLNR